jgi:hypothetical protein
MSNSDLITAAAAYYKSSSHSTTTRAQYATQPAKENWMKKTQNLFFLFAMDFVPFVSNRTPTQKKGEKKKKNSQNMSVWLSKMALAGAAFLHWRMLRLA